MQTTLSLSEQIQAAEAADDLDALEQMLLDAFEALPKGETTDRPFGAQLRMKPDFAAKHPGTSSESAACLDTANWLSRARRRVTFHRKIKAGFNGLVLVEEGDSWTQHALPRQNIYDHLADQVDMAIFSVGAGGGTIADMAREKEYMAAIQAHSAAGLILSGGGNDLVDDSGVARIVAPYDPHKAIEALILHEVLDAQIDAAIGHYRTILDDVASLGRDTLVFGHGYDVPHPERDGKWLGGPLASMGYPMPEAREVVRILIDRFNAALAALQAERANFLHTDLRGIVDAGPGSWCDELHPSDAGYGRAATAIGATIRRHLTVPKLELSSFEGAARPTIVLDPGHGGTQDIGGSGWNHVEGPAGTLEKTLTLDIAKRAKAALQARGFEVLLTRAGDKNPSLAARASIAKAARAPVFVSIHLNGLDGAVQGTETFVHPAASNASRSLCRMVQAQMVEALGHPDRNASLGGVKEDSLGVLAPSGHADSTAAILHAVSFMDVAAEEDRLNLVSYRQRIAQALADGIEGYLSGIADGVPDGRGHPMQDGFDINSLLAPTNAPEEARRLGHDLVDTRPAGPGASGSWIDVAACHLAEPLSIGSQDDLNEAEVAEVDSGLGPHSFGSGVEENRQILYGHFSGLENAAFDYAGFDAFVRGLGLRYFEPMEFLALGGAHGRGGACGGKNSLPPRSSWSSLANSARMIDAIRDRLGAPVRILSCYRNDIYNACVGGASNSLHKRFNAIDWVCETGNSRIWHDAALEVRASNPRFAGGIGLNISQNFVHIDTRGHDSDWTKR